MRFSTLAVHALAFLALHDSFPGSPGSRGLLFARAEDEGEPASVVPPQEAEKYPFEAEVHRMLDIVVNSLYQHNEVFLRELISNASDALDKMRYLALSKPDQYKKSDEDDIPLQVQIEFDPEQRTLTVRDTGCGMTHDDLVSNLGTVARSGTTKFIESLRDSGNSGETLDQIGQFGVGFYSAFLVADRVTVASKSPDDAVQHIWESRNGSGDFLVYPDPRGNSLERGTEITLHLKDDSLEYADHDRIRDLARHYSEFVVYPISLRSTTTVMVDVEEEEVAEESETIEEEKEKKGDDEDLEVGEESEAEEEEQQQQEEKKGPHKKKVETHSWEVLNGNQAIWTRDKDSITDEEYTNFFHTLAGSDESTCSAHSHFIAEGNINFKSILYLPDDVPSHYKMGSIDNVQGGMKLFVRRVLISDSFDLLPRYLGFIRGVVDSDDLPLNVNRETLQEHKILMVIKKKVVRKAIDMIRHFAADSEGSEEEAELDEVGNVIEPDPLKPKENKYIQWYKKFSANIKLGVIEDEANRGKLSKLLRFVTSKSDGEMISLDQYIENKKDWQDEIYVLGGTSVNEIEASPFLEIAEDKGVEVLYLTDAVDEYMVKQIVDYKNMKFVHLSSEGVKFKDESNDVILRREKLYKKKFASLVTWLRKLFHGTVLRVQVAKRPLGSVPAIVSSSDFGNSANMERILRAQAFQHGVDETGYMALKVFEFNPRHPLILKLLEGCPPEGDTEFEVAEEITDAAWMIHDMAMLNGGFPVSDANKHNKRMLKVLQNNFALESMSLVPELDPDEEEEEVPEPEGDGLNAEDFDTVDIDEMLDADEAAEEKSEEAKEEAAEEKSEEAKEEATEEKSEEAPAEEAAALDEEEEDEADNI